MEFAWIFFILSFCFSVLLPFQILLTETRKVSKNLPPGPWGWPVVGNLFDLGEIQTILELGKKYGPVMWLQLGAMNTVIIQSTEAAREMFKNHDLTYSGRTITEAMRACSFNQGAMSVAQYGPYWRAMKRLCITELATNKLVNETTALRRNCIDKMIHWIEEEATHKHEVCVAHFVFLMTFNLLGNLMLSRDLMDPQSKEGLEFFNAVDGLMQAGGQPNVADFFPLLKWFDPQGIRKKMDRHLGKAMQIVAGYVKERIEGQNSGEQKNRKDFLDALLEYEGEEKVGSSKISERDLVIMIMEIFIAGTETTSSTIEWAIAELLRNSTTMSKVQKELEDVVGCRTMEESDIEELHYLQAVVKETLRLHPPIPLLVPRKAVKDNEFMGYHIPKDTQVLVNAWATGRDPDCWNDPLSFKPERFLGSDIDYRGQHFELIPFGAGRRICAGIPLAHRVLHLALGSLLHIFKWDLHNSVTPGTIDMKERMGITLRKKIPLKAIPRKQV